VVVVPRVAAGVDQRRAERDEPRGLPHGRGEVGRVLARPDPGTAPTISWEAVSGGRPCAPRPSAWARPAAGGLSPRGAPRSGRSRAGPRARARPAPRRATPLPGPPCGHARSARLGPGGTSPFFSSAHEAGRRAGQGRVARHPGESRRLAQLPPPGGERHDAAVVCPQEPEPPQREQGEELRLGVVTPGARAGVRRKCRLARGQGAAGHAQDWLAHAPHVHPRSGIPEHAQRIGRGRVSSEH
jgi:hypothetical protein